MAEELEPGSLGKRQRDYLRGIFIFSMIKDTKACYLYYIATRRGEK
jgi:hypothetical protein